MVLPQVSVDSPSPPRGAVAPESYCEEVNVEELGHPTSPSSALLCAEGSYASGMLVRVIPLRGPPRKGKGVLNPPRQAKANMMREWRSMESFISRMRMTFITSGRHWMISSSVGRRRMKSSIWVRTVKFTAYLMPNSGWN